MGLPWWISGKESACNAGDAGSIPGLGRSPGGENAAHCSILSWEMTWTEEPGGLQPWDQKRDTVEQPNHQQIKLGSTANHLDSSLTFQGKRKGTPRILQRPREIAGEFTLAGLEVTVVPSSLLKRQALSSRDL